MASARSFPGGSGATRRGGNRQSAAFLQHARRATLAGKCACFFFNTLEGLHWRVNAHAFADHAAYSRELLNFSPDLPVVMTEKDAVKCRDFAADDWWYLAVDAQPSQAFVDWFDAQLKTLLPAS
nr:tetraacyldisaccharide 4'-kinase [Pseudomonas sp. S9]